MCSSHRCRSSSSVLKTTSRPGSSSPASSSTRNANVRRSGCPPPASSAMYPALAAAATMPASTVVGVIPARITGGRPVARVYFVSRCPLTTPGANAA